MHQDKNQSNDNDNYPMILKYHIFDDKNIQYQQTHLLNWWSDFLWSPVIFLPLYNLKSLKNLPNETPHLLNIETNVVKFDPDIDHKTKDNTQYMDLMKPTILNNSQNNKGLQLDHVPIRTTWMDEEVEKMNSMENLQLPVVGKFSYG